MSLVCRRAAKDKEKKISKENKRKTGLNIAGCWFPFVLWCGYHRVWIVVYHTLAFVAHFGCYFSKKSKGQYVGDGTVLRRDYHRNDDKRYYQTL